MTTYRLSNGKNITSEDLSAFEHSLVSVNISQDSRSAGRPRKGEVVEETETLTLRLPKGMIEQITEAAHDFGISRNRFLKIGAMRMIENPILEADIVTVRTSSEDHNYIFENVTIGNIKPFRTLMALKQQNYLTNAGSDTVSAAEAVSPIFSDYAFAGGTR